MPTSKQAPKIPAHSRCSQNAAQMLCAGGDAGEVEEGGWGRRRWRWEVGEEETLGCLTDGHGPHFSENSGEPASIPRQCSKSLTPATSTCRLLACTPCGDRGPGSTNQRASLRLPTGGLAWAWCYQRSENSAPTSMCFPFIHPSNPNAQSAPVSPTICNDDYCISVRLLIKYVDWIRIAICQTDGCHK